MIFMPFSTNPFDKGSVHFTILHAVTLLNRNVRAQLANEYLIPRWIQQGKLRGLKLPSY
jgi:hypothetical protein